MAGFAEGDTPRSHPVHQNDIRDNGLDVGSDRDAPSHTFLPTYTHTQSGSATHDEASVDQNIL